MTVCLVLGGSGFLGSHLVDALLEKNYKVKVFSDFESGTKNIRHIVDRVELIKGNFLNDYDDLKKALKDTSYLFQFISTTLPSTSFKDPLFDIKSNVIGSVKLFELAVKSGVEKIIFSSSGGTVYGEPKNIPIKETDPTNPLSPHAISKLMIEKYLAYYKHLYGIEYVIFRYSNSYGERQNPYGKQGIIPISLNLIKQGKELTVYGDGSNIRDYIYVKDAIEATLFSLKKTKFNIYNVGSNEGISINQLIEIMSKITKKKIKVKYLKSRYSDISKIVLDTSRIEKEFKWKPKIKIDEGIKLTWNWIN